MSSKKTRLCEELKGHVMSMIDDLGTILTKGSEISDINLVSVFFKPLHPEVVMEKTIKKLLPREKEIQDRDIHFFVENTYIFSGLPENRVAYYSKIFTSRKRISPENMEIMWQYLDLFITYAKKYKKMD